MFIASTCANGDHFLIVVRSQRWRAVAELLQAQPVFADLSASDRLLVLDAEETLQKMMRDGMPNARLFDEALGQLVARVARAGGHLRIYCELVDILAERDNFPAVHALERLWNAFGNAYAFTLVCGYAPERFASPSGWDELQTMCTAHARILPT